MKQKRYPQEFKEAVVQRIMAGESQTAVANSLGISVKTVGHWYTKVDWNLEGRTASITKNGDLQSSKISVI